MFYCYTAAPDFEKAPELEIVGSSSISLECSFNTSESEDNSDLQYTVKWYKNDQAFDEVTLTANDTITMAVLDENDLPSLAYNDEVNITYKIVVLFISSKCFSLFFAPYYRLFSLLLLSCLCFSNIRKRLPSISILIQSAAWQNRVKQQRLQLVLRWVIILVCQFLVIVFQMRLKTGPWYFS